LVDDGALAPENVEIGRKLVLVVEVENWYW